MEKKKKTRWLGDVVHIISRHKTTTGRDFFGQGNTGPLSKQGFPLCVCVGGGVTGSREPSPVASPFLCQVASW